MAENTTEQFTTKLSLEDEVSARAAAIAAALDKVAEAAGMAGAAVAGAGSSTDATAAKVTAAAAAWERVAARQDAVTAATVKLKNAQEELARVQALAAAGIAKGTADPEVVNRVLTAQIENINRLKQSLVEVRDAQEASKEANALWAGSIAAGNETLKLLAQSAEQANASLTKGSAEAAVYGRSLESLRAQFDSVFRTTKAYEKELADLNLAFKTGAIEGVEAQNRALDELNAKYSQATGTTETLTARKLAEAEASAKLVAQHNAERASFDSIYAVSKQYEAQLNKMQSALDAGRINQAQFDVALDKANAMMANATRTATAYATGHGQAAFATRQLGVQTVQFFSSLESGIPFMTALIQQGHQIVDVALATGTGFDVVGKAIKSALTFLGSPLGAGIAAMTLLTAGITAMTLATEGGEKALLALQQTLRATHADYQSLAGDVEKAARAAAASSPISTTEARQAGGTIAGAPHFQGSAQDIEHLIKLSNDLATVLGIKVPDAAKILEKAIEAPGKSAEEFGKKLQFGMTEEMARTIAKMEDSGHAGEAYSMVLKQLETATGATKDALTPFGAALDNLLQKFTSVKKEGDNIAAPQGPLSRLATSSVEAATRLVDLLQRSGSASPTSPQALLPWGGTQEQLVAKTPTPDTRLPGLTDALKQNAIDTMKAIDEFNRTMEKTVALTAQSPFGKLADAKASVDAFASAVHYLSTATGENTEKQEAASLSLRIAQKAYDEAKLAADNYFKTATEKSVEASNAQAKGLREIADASEQGGRAVVEATIYAKAYEAAIAQGLDPTSAKFTETVWTLVPALRAVSDETAHLKAVEEGRNLEGQIALIQAETRAIWDNSAANRDAVAAVRARIAAEKDAASGTGPDDAAHLLALRISKAAEETAKDNATLVDKYADKGKSGRVAQLNEDLAKLLAIQSGLHERTAENAGDWDKTTNAIAANHEEMAKATKGTATHVAALDKQKNTIEAQIQSTKDMEVAYQQGGDAVVDITAKLKAQEKLIADGILPTSKNWRAELEKMTAQFKDLGREQANLKAIQESKDIEHQIDLVKLETSMLLDNNEARTLAIQRKKDEYEVDKNNMSLDPAKRAALLAEKDALAKLTQDMNDKKQTAQYLASQFSSAFDTIGNSITDAFVKGSGSAVKWGSVMQGVLTQVIQQFAHLAILNPIMNSLFGGNQPTLSSVASLLGGGGGGGGAAAGIGSSAQLVNMGNGNFQFVQTGGGVGGGATTAGGGAGFIGTQAVGAGPGIGTVFGGGSIGALAGLYAMGAGGQGAAAGGGGELMGSASSLLSAGGNLYSIGQALFPSAFGSGGIGGAFSGIGESLGLTGSSGLLSGVTGLLNTSVIAPTLVMDAPLAGATLPGATAPALVGGATVGSLIGGIGAGYGVGSMVGGYVQGALGKVGPGPQIGAATGAIAGAVIGSVVPVVGTLVGALIGGVIGGGGGGLIGPKAASSFSSTMVRINDEGFLSVGGTTSQRVDASGERSAALSDAQHINDILASANVKVTSLAGGYNAPYFQIGQNTPGGFQDPSKFANFAAEFPNLRFRSDDALTQKFIEGRAFQGPEELGGVTTSLRDFENALKGTKAESDTMGIALRALSGVSNTDVQPALQKAATFITATFPTLTQGNRGSLAVAQDQVTKQYGDALGMASQLGFGYDDLIAARQKLYEKNQRAADTAINQTAENVNIRYFAARAQVTGSRDDALTSQLISFDTQAKQAHQQLSDTLLGIWGDAAETSADFQNRMAEDDKATAEERLAIQVAFNRQTQQLQEASNEQLMALQARADTAGTALTGDPGQMQRAQILNLNRSQQVERSQFFQSEQQTFGDSFAASDTNYQAKLDNLLAAQTYEMAALAKSIDRQNLNLAIASTRQDQGITVRSAAASAALYPTQAGAQAAYYKFDVAAQQEQTDFYISMRDTYGDAYTVGEEYGRKLNALVAVQGQERLVLEQTINQRLRQQAIASWQQSIGFNVRRDTARAALGGDPVQMASAQLSALYVQQVSEMQNLQEGLKSTYGDAYATTAEYYGKVADLQDAQTAEMQQAQHQINRQLQQLSISSSNQDASFALRYQKAHAEVTGSTADKNAAALASFDEAAREELTNLYMSLTETYGDAYAVTAAYGEKVNALVKAQGEERLSLEKQQQDALTQTAEVSIASLVQYSKSLQTSDKSPLSPLAQLDLAKSQFTTQSALAGQGDFSAVQSLQTYADNYLTAAHTVYGSGMDYVKAFSEVISAIATVATNTPDTLTASVLQQETRTQTSILVEQLQELKDEVAALRLAVTQGSAAPARIT